MEITILILCTDYDCPTNERLFSYKFARLIKVAQLSLCYCIIIMVREYSFLLQQRTQWGLCFRLSVRTWKGNLLLISRFADGQMILYHILCVCFSSFSHFLPTNLHPHRLCGYSLVLLSSVFVPSPAELYLGRMMMMITVLSVQYLWPYSFSFLTNIIIIVGRPLCW